MKTELADGHASDSESLSWHMRSLLKAVAVSLAYERARAILKLQQNLRIYPHRVLRAAQMENESVCGIVKLNVKTPDAMKTDRHQPTKHCIFSEKLCKISKFIRPYGSHPCTPSAFLSARSFA